jgi:esterase/lipase superfamily enzyme
MCPSSLPGLEKAFEPRLKVRHERTQPTRASAYWFNVYPYAAPDVGLDMFRTEIQGMGTPRPRFFASQDDSALNFSKTIGGGVDRIGAINPAQEPYKVNWRRRMSRPSI